MRIISLIPSFTEILSELGVGQECLAGITDHCPKDISDKAKRLGSPKAINLSELETLSFDCILAQEGENRPEQIRELQKKYKVLTFEVRSIPAVLDTIQALGRLVERTQESECLQEKIIDRQKENQKVFSNTRPIPTLILLWNKPYLTVNFDTYVSRLVEASGAVNVFHQDPLREFPVEIEDMIEKEPELLLLPKAPFPFQKRHAIALRKYRVFSTIRIELISGEIFSRFGPKTVQALEALQKIIKNPI